MAKEVQIVVSAKDMTSQVFKRLELSTAATIKRLDSLSQSAERAGRAMTTALTLPIVAAGGAALKMAADAEETSNKFNVTFKEMADSARAFTNQMASDMQRSRVQMENFAADTQAILAPMLENRKAAAELSKAVAALSVDLGSFFNIADNDALNRLHSGLMGETEAVRRLGIDLSQATLEMEAHRMGIEQAWQELSQAQKVYVRFSAIIRQTKDAQGDAIRTADSLTNQWKALKAEVSDLAVEIGQELVPYGLAAVSWAREMVKAVRDLSPETKEAAIKMAGLIAIVGPGVTLFAQLTKAVGLTLRAINLLSRVLAKDPKWAIAIIGGTIALQQFIEHTELGQKLLDQFLDVTGLDEFADAWKEIDEALSQVEFDPAKAVADAEALRTMFAKAADVAAQEAKNLVGTTADAMEEEAEKRYRELSETMVQLLADAGVVVPGSPFMTMKGEELADALKQGYGLDENELQDIIRVSEKLKQAQDEAFNPDNIRRRMAAWRGEEFNEVEALENWLAAREELLSTLSGSSWFISGEMGFIQGQSTRLIQDRISAGKRVEALEGARALTEANLAWGTALADALGEDFDEVQAKIENTINEINALRDAGFQVTDEAIQQLLHNLAVYQRDARGAAVSAVKDTWLAELGLWEGADQTAVAFAEQIASARGEEFSLLREQIDATVEALNQLRALGLGIDDYEVQEVLKKLSELQSEYQEEQFEDTISSIRERLKRGIGEGLETKSLIETYTGDFEFTKIDALQEKIAQTEQYIREMIETIDAAGKDVVGSGFWEEIWDARMQLGEYQFQLVKEQIAEIERSWKTAAGMDDEGAQRFAFAEAIAQASNEDFPRLQEQIRATQQALETLRELGFSATSVEARKYLEELERLNQELKQERLDSIRSELGRTLTDRLEIETVLSRASGQRFDPLQFQIDAFQSSINQMVEEMLRAGDSVGEITDEIGPLLVQLAELIRVQKQMTLQATAVDAALGALAADLQESNPIAAGLVRSAQSAIGPTGFSMETFLISAVQEGVNIVASLIAGLFKDYSDITRAMQRDINRIANLQPTQDALSISQQFADIQNRESYRSEAIALREQQAAMEAELRYVSDYWASFWEYGLNTQARAERRDELEQALQETKERIDELTQKISQAEEDLIRSLGIAADNFASGIQNAFDEADMAGFSQRLEENVKQSIRNALVQAFIARALQPQIEALAENIQQAILNNETLNMDSIQQALQGIEDTAAPFYEALQELGLAALDSADGLRSLGEQLHNVPSTFKYALYAHQIEQAVPGMASGGYVPARLGGTIVRLGEGGEGEWVIPESRTGRGSGGIHLHFHGPVYGIEGFKREVKRIMSEAVRESKFSTAGVV